MLHDPFRQLSCGNGDLYLDGANGSPRVMMSATDLKGVVYLCSQLTTANCNVLGYDQKSLLTDG